MINQKIKYFNKNYSSKAFAKFHDVPVPRYCNWQWRLSVDYKIQKRPVL